MHREKLILRKFCQLWMLGTCPLSRLFEEMSYPCFDQYNGLGSHSLEYASGNLTFKKHIILS